MNILQNLNQIISWFQPSPNLIKKSSAESSEDIRHCRHNIVAGLFLSVMVIIMFFIRYSLEGVVSLTLYGLLAASLIIASIPFVIKYTANYQITTGIYLLLALVILPIRVLETGGFSSTVMSWYLIACMLFFVLGSIRWGLVVFILIMLELGVIYFVLESSLGNTNFLPSNDIQFWVFVVALSIGVGVIYWYEKQRILSISELEEKNIKISSDNNLLALQKNELEKVNLDKSTLLSVLCHDIANPLQIISACAEIMEGKVVEKKHEKYINNIFKATTVINEIICHVRSVQTANIQVSGLKLEPVNLREGIENAIFVFENKLLKKGLTLAIDEKSFAGVKVLAEPVSLNNFVINNVISNAIKFSDEGGQIEISSEKEEGKVCLKIKDSGIGMTAEMIEDLFAINKLLSREGTQGEEGSGLGMKVMSSYVSGYGGYVRVVSTLSENGSKEKGTTFYLCLREA